MSEVLRDAGAPDSGLAWFCMRAQPKHEHIAAARLREMENIEVFVPRIRFKRPTIRKPIWVTEALFPSYFFARFDWHTSLRRVRYCAGVSGVVHFGDDWPIVPDSAIAQLRALVGEKELHVIPADLAPGDRIKIVGGAFHGFDAVVSQVMPASERVAVLMEFLGRETVARVHLGNVVKDVNERAVVLSGT